MASKNRFLDGVLCTCGQLKDELDISICEICSDACCGDCLLKCASCRNKVCRNCKSVFEKTVCQDCENPYIEAEFNDLANKVNLDDVFIVTGGNSYHISNKNGMAMELVNGTEPILPMSERIRTIDIKGLGVLVYSHRSIRGRGVGNGVEYYLYFNPFIDDLPFDVMEVISF